MVSHELLVSQASKKELVNPTAKKNSLISSRYVVTNLICDFFLKNSHITSDFKTKNPDSKKL